MARIARVKSSDSIFHIMIRSISEINLFELDDDKQLYLDILKYYQCIHHFKVYAYCLMSNHGHFIIDANGADISRIMHNINFRYSIEFNKKHNRRGPLFQGRFKSKVITSQKYLVTVSAYIHRNPVDIKNYKSSPEKYKYSSLSTYLGLEKDTNDIIDEDFIMQLFSTNVKKARKKYYSFIYLCDDKKLIDAENVEASKSEYHSKRSIIKRDLNPQEVLNIISSESGVKCIVSAKNNNLEILNARAFSAVILRGLYNLTCSDISEMLGNIPLYIVSKLCEIGVELLDKKDKYKNLLNNIISLHTA